jgi:hypothetical protein
MAHHKLPFLQARNIRFDRWIEESIHRRRELCRTTATNDCRRAISNHTLVNRAHKLLCTEQYNTQRTPALGYVQYLFNNRGLPLASWRVLVKFVHKYQNFLRQVFSIASLLCVKCIDGAQDISKNERLLVIRQTPEKWAVIKTFTQQSLIGRPGLRQSRAGQAFGRAWH